MFQFADGFDNYSTISQIWESVFGSASIMSSTYARFAPPAGLTGMGIQFAGTKWATKNLLSNSVTLIVGVPINVLGLPGSGGGAILFVLDSGTIQVWLGVTSTGALQFYRGSGTSNPIGSATAPSVIQPNVYHFYEAVITIDPSAGSVALYLDGSGIAAINNSGLNTRATSNSWANQVGLGNPTGASAGPLNYDDLRVFDSTGARDNAVLGDTRIITKMPTGAGDFAQWTAHGAGSNYACCNEIPPDDDTTYVASSTIAQEDSYAMQSAGLLVAPNFLVVRQRIRKDDSAARGFQGGVRSAGVNGFGPVITVPSSYAFFDTPIPNDPNTGFPWTASGADSAQVAKLEAS